MVKKFARVTKLTRSSKKQKTDLFSGVKNYSFGESRAYLFEYGLLLLTLGFLVLITVSMTQQIIKTIIDDKKLNTLNDLSDFSTAVLMVSAVFVLLPLFVILTQRTAQAERTNSKIKNSGWRKAFLGIFLATTGISAVVSGVYFVNSFLAYLSGLDTVMDWGQTLGLAISTAIIVGVVWTFSTDYRYVSKEKPSKSLHIFRYSLVLGVLIISSLFIMGPMTKIRDNTKPTREYDRYHHSGMMEYEDCLEDEGEMDIDKLRM